MGALKTRSGEKLREAEIERALASWVLACNVAARALGADQRKVVQTRGVVGRGADALTSRARKVACYLAVIVGNNTQARLADAVGIDRATVHGHLEWVEDEREKADFDQLIGELEEGLLRMAVAVVIGRLGKLTPAEAEAAA